MMKFPAFVTAFAASWLYMSVLTETALCEDKKQDKKGQTPDPLEITRRTWMDFVPRLNDQGATSADAKVTCVIRGTIVTVCVERRFIAPSGIRSKGDERTHLVIDVAGVLKRFDLEEYPDKKYLERITKDKNLDWPNLKSGDRICVTLPWGMAHDRVGEVKNNKIFPLTGGTNLIRETIKERRNTLIDDNAGKEPTPDELNKNVAECLSRWGLKEIPQNVPWLNLVDEQLFGYCNVPWDTFFNRMELEAEIAGLLKDENEEIIKYVNEKATLEKDKEHLMKLAQRPSPLVRRAIGLKLLSAGDLDGIKCYNEIFRFALLKLQEKDLTSEDSYGNYFPFEGRGKKLIELTLLKPYLDDLKNYVDLEAFLGHIPDPPPFVPPVIVLSNQQKELLAWLEKDHKEELLFDAQKRRFVKRPESTKK